MYRFITKPILIATSIAALLCCQALSLAVAERAAVSAAMASITAEELKEYVDTLSDDVFEGREGGSRGGRAAATYLREQLEKLKAQPGGVEGTFFQSFGDQMRNVLAIVEGSDPGLKDQYIVVGAHYDHVGYGTRGSSFGPIGYIHNGADDNASGAAALLELLQALRQLPYPPKRSILIAFWDGEEKGLLGSRHWVDNPTIPIEKIRFVINMDMIGRLRDGRLDVWGTRSGRGMRRLVAESGVTDTMQLNFSWSIRPNSDHWPFYQKSIPYLMLHTGLHDDYHRPSDDAHLINNEGIAEITRLLFRIVTTLADAPELPEFRKPPMGEALLMQRILEAPLPPLPARLGISWQPNEKAKQSGVIVKSVTEGLPADTASVQPGDRIVALGEHKIDNGKQLQQAVFATGGETTLVVERAGEAEPLELLLTLPPQKARIGISWREDDGEPGTVVVSRVVPGSPAAVGGLRVRDRIYQVDGQGFAGRAELEQQLGTAREQVVLRVERRGRLQDVTLKLAE